LIGIAGMEIISWNNWYGTIGITGMENGWDTELPK
jgi:hypothetical protein